MRPLRIVLVFLGVVGLVGAQTTGTQATQSLPTLEVEGRSYSNVTLKACDDVNVTVTHDAGIKNLRLEDLTLDQMKALNATTTAAAIDLSKVDPNPPSPAVVKKVGDWIGQAGGINRRLENGNTPLIEAVLTGQSDYVKVALKKRADPNATSKDNHTPWYEAAVRGYTEIAEMLEKAGAKVPNLLGSVESGDLETVNLFLTKDPKACDSKDDAGRTLLMIASRTGRDKVAEVLISKGAVVDARDAESRTALVHAAGEAKKDVVKLLIDKGADVNARDRNGITPLIAATQADSLETVQVLLDSGVSTRPVDRQNGWNALMHATSKRNSAIVKLLLERGARTDQTDRQDKTAIAIARGAGHEELVELLTQAHEIAEKAKLEKQKSVKRVLGEELASQGEEQVRQESIPKYVPYLIWAGVLIAIIGHIWLTLVAIHDGVTWGLLVLFFNPLGGLLYTFGRGLGHIRGALPIFVIYLVGIGLVWIPAKIFDMNLFEFFLSQ